MRSAIAWPIQSGGPDSEEPSKDSRRQRHDDLVKLMRPGDEAVIRDGSGQRRRRLHGVNSAHLPRPRGIAARGVVAREAQVPRRRAQEIAVDGEDNVRRREFRRQFDWLAVRKHSALYNISARDRLPPVPAGFRVKCKQRIELPSQGRRG